MKWKWCNMCRFDGHCENQNRNMECACYAREQTLRAEQYANLIDKQQKQLEIAVKRIKFLKTKTGAPYYGNNTYLKTIYQMCDKTLRQIQELEK